MPILSFLLSASQALGGLVDWMRSRQHSGRQAVADYFEQVAGCLQEVAERIEEGQVPRDTCRRLAVYADELGRILEDRGYVTAVGDVTIDETRLRLAGELKKANVLWDAASLNEVDPAELAKNELSAILASSHFTKRDPADATVDRAEQEIAARAGSRTLESAQPVWDAVGEFRALAHSLRAR